MRASLAARRLALCAAVLTAWPESRLSAQTPTAATVNFFGPDPKSNDDSGRNPVVGLLVDIFGSRSSDDTPPALPGMEHLLTFQDGRQLRGELVSLLKDEIQWKRGDASEILRFTRAEIRSVTLGASLPLMAEQVQHLPTAVTPPKPSRATIKLPGSDWLYADVQSKDGETFELTMGQAKFSVPRSAVQWMHFGMSPAPAARLTAGPMALEGWARSTNRTWVDVNGGWMQVIDGDFIGRNVTPPKRFEIAFDLDATDPKQTGLWIQPFGPQPNCYGTGTVNLEFKPGEIQRCIFINNIKHETFAVPKDADPDGRARIRVFYDGLNDKVLVYRNGQPVGDWKLKDDNNAQQLQNRWSEINGVCLNRQGGPKLGQFRILPWDGTLPPAAGETAPTQDSLTIGKEAPVLGKVGEINPTDLYFSGVKKPRGGGVFLQFPNPPAPEKPAEAALLFGQYGEVAASGLEVKDGRATFQTNFSGPLDVQASTLQVIAFAPAPVTQAPPGALVFKNGDELPGTLLRAAHGASLRWKTPSGQELDVQSERVAGVRMPPQPNAKSPEGAVLELRNGDRLRGELAGFDEKQIQFRHPTIGALTIDRDRVWSILPGKSTVTLDASNDPGPWVQEGTKEPPGKTTAQRRLYLDGRFLMRADRTANSSDRDNITRTLETLPDQMEIRCEALDMSGNEPNLSLRLASKTLKLEQSSLQIDFSYGSLRYYGWVSGPKPQNFWKDVNLRDRHGRYSPTPRISTRIFINNKTGTVDIYVNGEHKVKSGPVNERMPGIAHSLTISGSSGSDLPLVISDVWVGPWSGELPKGEPQGCVIMANGDQADTPPKTLREGNLIVEAAGGEMEIPVHRVSSIQFPGPPKPTSSAGRLRLASGDAISVDSFSFDGREVTARSADLGELCLPAAALRELIFAARPMRFPETPAPKKRLVSEIPPILPAAP